MDTGELLQLFNKTKENALAPKTLKLYKARFNLFINFMKQYYKNIPPEPITLNKLKIYLAYRVKKNCLYNTICSDITAFSYYFRKNNLEDITENYAWQVLS